MLRKLRKDKPLVGKTQRKLAQVQQQLKEAQLELAAQKSRGQVEVGAAVSAGVERLRETEQRAASDSAQAREKLASVQADQNATQAQLLEAQTAEHCLGKRCACPARA